MAFAGTFCKWGMEGIIFIALSRPGGFKTFLCPTHMSMEFVLVIHLKKPTIVGILKFMMRTNDIVY